MSTPTRENIAQYDVKKEEVEEDLRYYLSSTPELRQLLHDFTTSCVTLKPKDVREYAAHYFGKLKSKSNETTPPVTETVDK